MSKTISWENLRPWPVYLTAAMLPFSLAATNLFKAFTVVFALVAFGLALKRHERLPALTKLRTPLMVGVLLAALALSLLYTSAPMREALLDLNKYSKLLLIPLVLLLVRTGREAMMALGFYIGAETFVVLTSYLLATGWNIPWVIKPLSTRVVITTVYSSYLDQSIMTAGMGTLAWHLRSIFPGRYGPTLAVILALLCAVNVIFLLPGRSGQAALLIAIALTTLWAVPRHSIWLAVVVPVGVLAFTIAVSPQFTQRAEAVISESQGYFRGDKSPTSSAQRLSYWQRSVEMIGERPFLGHGVGSWNVEYRRLEGDQLRADAADLRNPHQEYLLWGTQLGLGGIVLLIAFMGYAFRDALPFVPPVRRATLSFVAILAVVCLFNASIFDALIGDYFCVLLGLLLALGFHSTPAQTPELVSE